MMKLVRKEIALVTSPIVYLFFALSAMVLIPSYPYYVIFFYTMLGIFFCCQGGRENHDLEYTLALPIRKRAVVTARLLFVMLVEAIQLLLALLFSHVRALLSLPPNAAGMEANVAFFGLSLLLLGIFHLTFFPLYYKAPDKVGKVFATTSVVVFVVIGLLEVCAHALPFFREKLDTPDPLFLQEKLAVLLIGLAGYLLLTGLAHKISVGRFEQLDL